MVYDLETLCQRKMYRQHKEEKHASTRIQTRFYKRNDPIFILLFRYRA